MTAAQLPGRRGPVGWPGDAPDGGGEVGWPGEPAEPPAPAEPADDRPS